MVLLYGIILCLGKVTIFSMAQVFQEITLLIWTDYSPIEKQAWDNSLLMK